MCIWFRCQWSVKALHSFGVGVTGSYELPNVCACSSARVIQALNYWAISTVTSFFQFACLNVISLLSTKVEEKHELCFVLIKFILTSYTLLYNSFWLPFSHLLLSLPLWTPALQPSLQILFPHFFVWWSTEYNQGCLSDHRLESIHWSMVSSPVGTNLKITNFPLQNLCSQ